METLLKREEQLVYELRKLYRQYGYSQFKMSKFEPYDLYASNKDFLVSDGVITFTDTDGALLALKPDVTLSIVKNFRNLSDSVQKSYYNENVYRTDRSGQGFREIVQTGLECVGAVDQISVCEVLCLAVKTLEKISEEYVLDISNMGILEEILGNLELDSAQKLQIISCIEKKNEDALHHLPFPLPKEAAEQILTLVRVYGPVRNALEDAAVLSNLNAYQELRELADILEEMNIADHINLDFSIIGAKNYYNGLIFRGYIAGIPASVVSGGQYDRLMKKMGKRAKGIGFAVYLNQLETLHAEPSQYDQDTVLVYGNASAKEALSAAENLRAAGHHVLITRELPQDIRYKKCFILCDGKVEEYESNG